MPFSVRIRENQLIFMVFLSAEHFIHGEEALMRVLRRRSVVCMRRLGSSHLCSRGRGRQQEPRSTEAFTSLPTSTKIFETVLRQNIGPIKE